MVAGAVIVVTQIALPTALVLAASGTATVTNVSPANGPAGIPVLVAVGGCVTPNGMPNTARVFVRGPGASTAIVSQAVAGVPPPPPPGVSPLPPGSFSASLITPIDAAIGSTFKLSAQCTEQGQAPGPESGGVVFTVTSAALSSSGPTTGIAGTTTGMATSPGGATTGRATPITQTPRFTG